MSNNEFMYTFFLVVIALVVAIYYGLKALLYEVFYVATKAIEDAKNK
jgi:hypothetical protein